MQIKRIKDGSIDHSGVSNGEGAQRHGQRALTISIMEGSVPDYFYHLFIGQDTFSHLLV